MKLKNETSADVHQESYVSQRLTTVDVAKSLQDFINAHFTGCIRFDGLLPANKLVLFDKTALAFMIKCIIKEITITRVCKIGFEVRKTEFFIRFTTGEERLPDGQILSNLKNAAAEYGVTLQIEGRDISIIIPTLENKIFALYDTFPRIFLFALQDSYEEYSAPYNAK